MKGLGLGFRRVLEFEVAGAIGRGRPRMGMERTSRERLADSGVTA
jgi:hypothetical protein